MRIARFLAFVVGASIAAFACTAAQRQAAKTALDVISYACIIENATFDNEKIANVCAIESELRPALDELLKQHRMGVSKMGAKPCAPTSPASASGDAGVPATPVTDAAVKG